MKEELEITVQPEPFVKFLEPGTSGREVFIRPSHVIAISKAHEGSVGSYIFLTNETFHVSASVDDSLQRIMGAGATTKQQRAIADLFALVMEGSKQ